MAMTEMNYPSSGGGSNTKAVATSSVTTYAESSTQPQIAVLKGTFTTTAQIAQNGVIANISPAPTSEISGIISYSNISTRTVTLKTNGELVNTGGIMYSGYPWDISLAYEI